jgi:hypothetical protein
MTAEQFANLLDARRSGEGWMAKCPAHEDRTASLSVGEGRDGRVLLSCFAGCSVYAITSAVGIELTDLFPPRIDTYAAPGRPPRHAPADLLRVLELEARIVRVAATTLANGGGLSREDYTRLEQAETRIAEVARRAFA